MKIYKLLLALTTINFTYTMEQNQKQEKPFAGKTLAENCKKYVIDNINKYFDQILSGKLPQELTEIILKQTRLYNYDLDIVLDQLENNNISEETMAIIIKKMEPVYTAKHLTKKKEIDKTGFDLFCKSKPYRKINREYKTYVNDIERKRMAGLFISNQNLKIDIALDKDNTGSRYHKIWSADVNVTISIESIINAIVNDDLQIGFELSNGKYLIMFLPTSYIENKLTSQQKILMMIIGFITDEDNWMFNPKTLIMIEKIKQSTILKTLPQNEFLACIANLEKKKKKLVEHRLSHAHSFKTKANYHTSYTGSEPEEDCQKFINFLQIYRHCNYLNIFEDILHILPIRIGKKLIKKLKQFNIENCKNVNIDQNLFDTAYKQKINSSEHQKTVIAKLKKILDIVSNQKELDKEFFKGYLLNLLEELVIQYFAY